VGIRGSPGSSDGRKRALLLLSLILLVWNIAATARFAFEAVPPSVPDPGIPAPNTSYTPDGASGPHVPVVARPGPLTFRQKYLLGYRIDINLATAEEISELPGVSDAAAAAVVAERERRGAFRIPRDLLAVPGIKEKRLQKILPFLAEMANN
jgi:competence ComEA-like helix-hairpin-helix protein